LNRQEQDALFAAVRLAAVVLFLIASLTWWLLQKAPDHRVDLRLRLLPDNEVQHLGPTPLADAVRDAWNLPVGQVARFHAVVPGDDAVLRFEHAYLQGLPDLAVRSVAGNGSRTDLATVHGSDGSWKQERIAVPVDAGEELDFEFVALDGRGKPGLGAVLLADVVLESGGRAVDETDNPVVARAVGVDLLSDTSLEMLCAPTTFEGERLVLPGPRCLRLEKERPRVLAVDEVPAGAVLEVVLHAGRLGEGSVEPGRVTISSEQLVLANLPVQQLVEPEGEMPPARELLASCDLSHWAGGPLALQLELVGGAGMWVGVRELVITQPEPRPRRLFTPENGLNVVLVIVDGLRADRLGYMGYPRAHTPVLDGLAARGLRYEHLVAPSSWALPNVASLLTGVHPLTHGLGLRKGRVLSPRLSTLAESAGWAGVMTACFTSSTVIGPGTGLDRGYEQLEYAPLPADGLVDRALDWLPEASQFEWFLTLHLTDPTWPYEPRAEDLLAVVPPPPPGTTPPPPFDPELLERLRALDSRPGYAEGLAKELGPFYDAEVAGVDRALGRLLDALAERELLDHTLVVVVASHGQEFFEHQGRMQGQTLFDEVVQVPLLLAGPGVVGLSPPPLFEREMVEMIDATQVIGQLGRLMSATHLPGRLPPPFGPSDDTIVAHGLLFPYPGLTQNQLEASRREGIMLLNDRRTDLAALYDLAAGPGHERNLLGPRHSDDWEEEARFLQDAFDDWYRSTSLASAARPVRYEH